MTDATLRKQFEAKTTSLLAKHFEAAEDNVGELQPSAAHLSVGNKKAQNQATFHFAFVTDLASLDLRHERMEKRGVE